MPKHRMVTVNLGDLQDYVESRVKSGDFASVSEVLRAAVRAMQLEQNGLGKWLKRSVEDEEARRPALPVSEDVLKRLRHRHAIKAGLPIDEEI